MKEQVNLTFENVIEIIQEFPLEPMFNKVIVTLNKGVIEGTLDLSENTITEEQFIIAKGPNVHNLEVGQKVLLDLDRLMEKRTNPNNVYEEVGMLKFDPIIADGIIYAILEDRFIKAKFKNNQPLQTNE